MSDTMHAVAVASASRPTARLPRVTWGSLVRAGPPAVLAALVGTYVSLFGFLAWRQHANWRSLGFDTGIYDQGMWLLAHGRDPFLTIRGMDYWGHHVALIGYLFAPIYWLGGGVGAVTLVHTGWVAAGAVPLWLLARDLWSPAASERKGEPAGSGGKSEPAGSGGKSEPAGSGGRGWVALAVPVAYLLHPAVHWVTWWLYHPDSMAITPLLFAWWLGRTQRWRWFAVACVVAMACKEDVALAVLVLGIVLVLRGRRGPEDGGGRPVLKAGAATALGAAAWFLFCSKVVIPLRNDHAPPFYESYFPSLGASLGEIVRNIVLHPSRPWRLLSRPRVPDYALKMLGPVGWVAPFLGPAAFLVAGPQLGVNLLVEVQDGATIKSQYASMPIVGIFLGVVEGMALLRRRPALLRAAAVWLVGCAVVGTHAWGLGPFTPAFHSGLWADHPRPNVAQLERAAATVPPQAPLAASWNLVTHFTHRPIVYEYPNPWVSSNYGPSGNEVGDPTTVDWIVVDQGSLGAKDKLLLARLVGPGGPFQVVQDEEGVTVARRVTDGSVVPP